MAEIIFIFLGASMWCFGFHVVINNLISEIYNLEFNDKWDELSRTLKLIIKPLFACPYCMASIHGTIIYFTFINQGLHYWPVFCFCLCGLNYLLSQFINE